MRSHTPLLEHKEQGADLVEHALTEIYASNRYSSETIQNHIHNWKRQVTVLLADTPLPEYLRNELHLFETAKLLSPAGFRRNLDSILSKLTVESSFYTMGRKLTQQNHTMPDEVFCATFFELWQQSVEHAILQVQLALIEDKRQELLAELAQKEANIDILDQVLDRDLFPSSDRLWDLASGKLSHLDAQLLQRFSKNLRKNRQFKEIASRLGRMALTHIDPETTPNSYETWILDNSYLDNIPDDMQGVTYSDEISRMLQTEAVNLSFPELEILFYKRYVERHLLSYQYFGAEQQYKKITQYRDADDDDEEVGGPFIVCVDSSASMQGFPELTAKSICYALMQIAFEQRRKCYVMMFSKEVVTYPITHSMNLSNMLTFLSSSFRGGTDLKPVIEKSLQLMQSEHYQNADTLIISDFIAQKLPTKLAAQAMALKSKKNRFHAISLSSQGNPDLMNIFDHVWQFLPGLKGRFTSVKQR